METRAHRGSFWRALEAECLRGPEVEPKLESRPRAPHWWPFSQILRWGEEASAVAVYIIRVPVHIIILALDCMASPEVAIRRGQSLVVRNDFIDSYPAAADVYDQVAMDCPTGGDCFWRWHYNATIAAAAAPFMSDRVC